MKSVLLVLLWLSSLLFATESSLEACVEGESISKIEFFGLHKTKKKTVYRSLLHRIGDSFLSQNWYLEKESLESLDLFAEVNLRCKKDSLGLVLEYKFRELFSILPFPAGKKTDQDGLMLGLALAHLNLWGENIRAELQYRTSIQPFFRSNEYAFYWTQMWFLNKALDLDLEFLRTDSYDNLRGFQEDSYLFDSKIQWNFARPYAFLYGLSSRYYFDFGEISSLSFGFKRDTRIPKVYTKNGFYQEMLYSYHFKLSDSKPMYHEYVLDIRYYQTISNLTGVFSTLWRIRTGDIPFYDRFYHGGANSFRGWNPDSLHYGEQESLSNIEARYTIRDRKASSIKSFTYFYGLEWVLGVDISVLWDSSPNWTHYHSAYYTGLHIIIPALERLRLEIGFSPDSKEPKLFIGFFEKSVSQRWRSR